MVDLHKPGSVKKLFGSDYFLRKDFLQKIIPTKKFFSHFLVCVIWTNNLFQAPPRAI